VEEVVVQWLKTKTGNYLVNLVAGKVFSEQQILYEIGASSVCWETNK
jgi:hypothetical protein